ncbi:MAG: TIGR00269 family protein [Candidatus Woesearchaeota archaeon]
MRCKLCSNKSVINTHSRGYLCKDHFIEYFESKIDSTIKRYKILKPEDKILVMISGGKDSSVISYYLKKKGYEISCLYINLGIEDYSDKSEFYAREHCKKYGIPLYVINLKELLGTGIGKIKTKRAVCSYCGLTKRYIFNKFAKDNNFSVVITGHNLDDEVSFIFSNLINWNLRYLARQGPSLPSEHDFVRKGKPLYELTEKEIVVYAMLNGIAYLSDECPYATNATSLFYKSIINQIEANSKGFKISFIRNFLRNKKIFFNSEDASIKKCMVCGMPSSSEICSFCKFWNLKKEIFFNSV